MSKTTKRVLLGIALFIFVVIFVPALLRAFALGLKGEYDPEVNKHRMDTRTCQFILTPERNESFLKCPLPKDFKIPDWPTKQAPLNKEGSK
jgi:hypothetical protein